MNYQVSNDGQKAKLFAAYALVKVNIKPPKKNKVVEVTTKKGGRYSYKYADLATIQAAINAALKETAVDGVPLISYFTNVKSERGEVSANVDITDTSTGATVSTPTMTFPANTSDPQAAASTITYLKRYVLSAAFDIATEDDTDGQMLQQQEIVDFTEDEANRFPVKYQGEEIPLKNVVAQAQDGNQLAQEWLGDKVSRTSLEKLAIKKLGKLFKLRKAQEEVKKRREQKAQEEAEKKKVEEEKQAKLNETQNLFNQFDQAPQN